MGYGLSFIGGLISMVLTVWFVCFSIFVLHRLDKIIELLGKK